MGYLFFDLETVPDMGRIQGTKWAVSSNKISLEEACARMDPKKVGELPVRDVKEFLAEFDPGPEWLEIALAAENANKRRTGIKEAIAKAGGSDGDWIKKASVTPELCKIAAMSYAFDGEDIQVIVDREDYDAELDILDVFWEAVARGYVPVGYNILDFDIPVIQVRSMILRISPSLIEPIDTGPRTNKVLDLLQKRYGYREKPFGLKDLCGLLGIPINTPDVDGSMVWDLYKNKEFGKIAEYAASDLNATRELFHRYSGIII